MIPYSTEPTPKSQTIHSTQTAPSVIHVALRRKMILLLGVVTGVGVAFAYYRLKSPLYEATAEVAVQTKRTDLVTGVNNQDTGREDYVAAQMARFRSPVLIEQALRRGGLTALPSLANQPNPTDTMLRNLSVNRGRSQFGENNLLTLSYTAHTASDCPAVLAALLDAHRNSVAASYEAEAAEALKAIVQARDSVQKQLEKTQNAYAEFRKRHPLGDKTPNGTSALRQRLDGIQAKRSALLLHAAEVEAKFKTVQAAQKAGRPPEILLAILTGSMDDSSNASARDRTLVLQEQLSPLLAQEQTLLASYGPNHPDVQAVRARIRAVQALFARAAPTSNDGQQSRTQALQAAIAQHLTLIQQWLHEADTANALLTAQEKQISAELVNVDTQEESYRAELAHLQQLYQGIVKRVQEVGLAKDVGGYDVQVISPPSIPRKIAPSGLLILPAGAFVGLICGLGLAFWSGNRDDRLLDAMDEPLPLPVFGSVPWFKAATKPANGHDYHPLLCSLGRPDSPESEAFQMVRTALYFGAGKGCRVLLVTSPSRSDGATVIAANLAVSIARSGKRAVLVDANFRAPRIGPMFGLSSSPGLAEILSGAGDPQDALEQASTPGLSILVAGAPPANPAESLASGTFAELLHWLRDRADFVIVDSPPALAVADATMIAPHTDGVLLALRLGRSTRSDIERVRQRFAAVGSTLVGAVLNGSQPPFLGRALTREQATNAHEQLQTVAVQRIGSGATARSNATD